MTRTQVLGLALLAAAGLCVVGLVRSPRGAGAGSPPVAVFPVAGSRLATPQTQIAFRGVPFSQLSGGGISVSGSRTGPHSGKLVADSDGQGGSFLPDQPFAAGEVVTVTSSLPILGGSGGTFHFTVAQAAGPIPYLPRPRISRVRGDVLRFHSAPTLFPAAVHVLKNSAHTAAGDIFVAPQYGPAQYGPMILDPRGGLIWFDPLPGNATVSDFRAQRYRGQPVLTWWEGDVNAGHGRGSDVVLNSSYQQIAAVQAANGLDADLHEFELTPQGTALITATYPVYWNSTSVHGSSRQIVLDGVVQEIDVATGLVLFEWHSLDHIPLTYSYAKPHGPRTPYDYFHLNSIDQDDDGNLVISARNTWAAYKLDHRSGRIIWTLGGKHSSFKVIGGAQFAFQHDVRVRASDDQFLTMFDDGASLPDEHRQSRAIKVLLSLKHRTVRLASQVLHKPPLKASFEGNVQQLPNLDEFVGWGQQPYFSEYNRHGKLLFDARFVARTANYRAYRFWWSGDPKAPPSVAASTAAGHTTVFVSWNGATAVASWRVSSGASPTALRAVRTAARTGFETSIQIAAARYVQVAGLDSRGNVLGSSSVVSAG